MSKSVDKNHKTELDIKPQTSMPIFAVTKPANVNSKKKESRNSVYVPKLKDFDKVCGSAKTCYDEFATSGRERKETEYS